MRQIFLKEWGHAEDGVDWFQHRLLEVHGYAHFPQSKFSSRNKASQRIVLIGCNTDYWRYIVTLIFFSRQIFLMKWGHAEDCVGRDAIHRILGVFTHIFSCGKVFL